MRTVRGLTALHQVPIDVRAVVLRGGGHHFRRARPLEVAEHLDPPGHVMHSLTWHQAFDAIEYGRMPVVTVLHGAVVGGGLELASSTHLRVAELSPISACRRASGASSSAAAARCGSPG